MNDVDSDFAGMTVNERLFSAGLLSEFDSAVALREKVKIISVLKLVEVDEKSISSVLNSLGLV